MSPRYGAALIPSLRAPLQRQPARLPVPTRELGLFKIQRPSEVPLVYHLGVLDTGNYLALQGRIAGHVAIVELYPTGYQVTWVKDLPPGWEIVERAQDPAGSAARLRDLLARFPKYNVVDNNCEHAANGLVRGARRSEQMEGLTLVAIVAGLALLFSRGK